jgi:DNA polymerase-3 subunit gamma/tau
LKTLEEPPEHVKFIFCTTEPTKIPITILSRCQRFDFAGILTRSIRLRLEQIVAAEGVEADIEALEVLARRAAGSMRDSQSLLEQLLAFSTGRITVADVHGMLGTAGEERLAALMDHLIARNHAGALGELDAALTGGVDAAQFIEQVFGYLRDCMVAAVGCPSDAFLYTSPSAAEGIAAAGKQLGLGTLLAIMQILDQTLFRMRYSTQGRILAELALVRICELQDLDDLAEMIAQLRSGAAIESNTSAPAGVKKKYEPAVGSVAAPAAGSGQDARAPVGDQNAIAPDDAPPEIAITAQNAVDVWNRALSRLSGIVVDQARQFDSIAFLAPNRLVIRFKPVYDFVRSSCERPEQTARFEKALREVTGQSLRVEFAVTADEPDEPSPAAAARAVPPHQRRLEMMQHPLVHRAVELFGAQVVDVVDPPPKE